MPPISVLIKPASSMCNMSCDYCFYCDEAEKRARKSFGFMSEQTLKNIIRKTLPHASGRICYAYQGGEPSLRGIDFFKKAVAYQRQYNQHHILVQNVFQTNGYGIREEWCDFFRENNFLVGLSVDGTPEIHNSMRHEREGGGATFDQVSDGAKRMDACGVNYNILTVVTKKVARNIMEIYYYYRDRGWHYQQYIACLDPVGEKHGQAFYALTPELYGEFLIQLFSLWLRDLKKGRQPYIRQFENWVGLAAGYQAESCDQRGTCGIQYVAEADGSIYPCDFYAMDKWRLGNLNQDRLEAVDARRKEIGFVERSLKFDTRCRQCKYYRLCRGGCQRNRDLNAATGLYENYYCQAYQMFFDQYDDSIVQLGDQVIKWNHASEKERIL